MRSAHALAILLHALLVSQCHGSAQDYTIDANDVDTVIDVLLDRPHKTLVPGDDTDLEQSTLGKSQGLRSSPASPLNLAAGATRHPPVSTALRALPPALRPLSRRAAIGESASHGGVPRPAFAGHVAAASAAAGTRARVAASAASSSMGYGSSSIQGTARKQNEDRVAVALKGVKGATGPFEVMAGVFDGHGGNAVSIWLQENYFNYILEAWPGRSKLESLTAAHLAADKELLKAPNFFSERGVGGSKCGSSAASFFVFEDPATGKKNFTTANVGDCRVYLVRGQKLEQLTQDHIPDDEKERKRIESFNPTPKQPLVKKVGDTWRLGGILALSRAFGDAFLKSTGQFEGLPQGGDGGAYSSGFGLIAEPFVVSGELSDADTYAILSSDGLFENAERGGGSGLTEEQILAPFLSNPAKEELDSISSSLTKQAQTAGSLDDVTVIAVKL